MEIIHYLNKLNSATGLQNIACHREIIKQRVLDFAKRVAGCFLLLETGELLFI